MTFNTDWLKERLITCLVPSHHPNQSWFIVEWVPQNNLENLNKIYFFLPTNENQSLWYLKQIILLEYLIDFNQFVATIDCFQCSFSNDSIIFQMYYATDQHPDDLHILTNNQYKVIKAYCL